MQLALLPLLAVLAASPNASLTKAEKLWDDLDYEGAAVALLEASKVPGNDLKTVTRILELQGVIAASLEQKSSAIAFFKRLLVLDPEYELSSQTYSAEQRAPFAQAKKVLVGVRPLTFEAASARAKPGQVESVAVKLTADPLTMAKRVRFTLKIGDAKAKEVLVPVVDGRAIAAVNSSSVSWWAELLGDFDAQLASVGSADKPLVMRAPGGFDPVAGPIDFGGNKVLALVAAGAGVVAVGAASYFGYQSRLGTEQIDGMVAEQADPLNPCACVHTINMIAAKQIVDSANSNAVVANILFVASGVLTAGGVALWLIEPEKSPGAGGGLGLTFSGRW